MLRPGPTDPERQHASPPNSGERRRSGTPALLSVSFVMVGVVGERQRVRAWRSLTEVNPPERIETDRLVLRPPEPDDADAVSAYQRDPDVTRYLTFPPAHDVRQAQAFLERCARAWQDGASFPLAITKKSGGEMIGMIETRPTGHGVEVGYVLGRSAWNNGFTSRLGFPEDSILV